MQHFTIYSGGSLGHLGLRGECVTPADARQLEQKVQQFFTTRTTRLWIDCQQLRALSWVGQLAMMQLTSRARALGITCYWCGLAPHLRVQRPGSGSLQSLHVLSASGFEGLSFLLASSLVATRLPTD